MSQPAPPLHSSFVPANTTMKEFTLRAVLLGLVMSVVLGAANAYLGLHAGQTIAATYPAAVIGMAFLRAFKGTVLEENIAREAVSLEFMERRHPRTFVGMSKDSATLYLCVVDGRQKRSVGMSFREIQEFLVQLGAWQAMNFDGGGSTTMVVKGKILNSPSDKTGERPVANALVVRRRNTTE